MFCRRRGHEGLKAQERSGLAILTWMTPADMDEATEGMRVHGVGSAKGRR